jgi:hypothetical protein
MRAIHLTVAFALGMLGLYLLLTDRELAILGVILLLGAVASLRFH